MSELQVTQGKIDDILASEKGDRVADEALYFLGRNWINRESKYDIDHLHPYARFECPPSGVRHEDWLKWRQNRNRLPNLQLLEGRSNKSKSDMKLIDYYNDMNSEQQSIFREQAIIPEDVSLEYEDFGEFYEKRKALLADRIRQLLRYREY